MTYTEADLERAKEFVSSTEAVLNDKDLAREFAKLRAEETAAERERCAKKCDEYAARMERAVESRPRSKVAECKMDAGQTLAELIRRGT